MFVSIYILGSKNILYNQNLHYYLFVFVLQNKIIFSPFKEAKLITAQVVSFISFLFSVGNIWALVQNERTRIYLAFTGGLLSLVVSVCLFIFRDKFKRRTLADTQQQMIVPKSQASKAENERADNSSPTVSRGDNQSLNDFEIGEFEIGELEQNDEVLTVHPDNLVEIRSGDENDDVVNDKV